MTREGMARLRAACPCAERLLRSNCEPTDGVEGRIDSTLALVSSSFCAAAGVSWLSK